MLYMVSITLHGVIRLNTSCGASCSSTHYPRHSFTGNYWVIARGVVWTLLYAMLCHALLCCSLSVCGLLIIMSAQFAFRVTAWHRLVLSCVTRALPLLPAHLHSQIAYIMYSHRSCPQSSGLKGWYHHTSAPFFLKPATLWPRSPAWSAPPRWLAWSPSAALLTITV